MWMMSEVEYRAQRTVRYSAVQHDAVSNLGSHIKHIPTSGIEDPKYLTNVPSNYLHMYTPQIADCRGILNLIPQIPHDFTSF